MDKLARGSDPAQPAGSDASWAIDPAQAQRLELTVAEYVETVASLDPRSQKFTRTVASIDRLGQHEFNAAAAMSGRTLSTRSAVCSRPKLRSPTDWPSCARSSTN